ncbi:hypothetical protein TrispH2_007990 [Trichoplax sp. H2]|nr:hypothetical protein TrispH2_007990 [Trichoplax sp. H2]|eukprot:RDD39688.1 hypothetical protein TrispH2_007990 [Trichoplax sp. H2]
MKNTLPSQNFQDVALAISEPNEEYYKQEIEQLKNIIRERDKTLESREEKLKTVTLQAKAKITRLNNELTKLKEKLPNDDSANTDPNGKESDKTMQNDSNTSGQGKMFANLKQKMLEKRKKQNEMQSQGQGVKIDTDTKVNNENTILELRDQLLSKETEYRTLESRVSGLEQSIHEKDLRLEEVATLLSDRTMRVADVGEQLSAAEQLLSEKEEAITANFELIENLREESIKKDSSTKELLDVIGLLKKEVEDKTEAYNMVLSKVYQSLIETNANYSLSSLPHSSI